MSRIKEAFKNGKAFIPFITAGYPDLATTRACILSAIENGADLIEIGIPFSDPTAEGPVIQTANVKALAGGVTTDGVLDFVRELRKEVTIPLVFMTYANVVFSYNPGAGSAGAGAAGAAGGATGAAGAAGVIGAAGAASADGAVAVGVAAGRKGGTDGFVAACREAGIDGLILPDVPYEERGEFEEACAREGLDLIPLIAPTSDERIARIAACATGFIYVVSSLGVTGVRSNITTDISAITAKIREVTDVPSAVGFGISTPEQAAGMAAQSDGAIVGSAIIRLIDKYGTEAAPEVGKYVKSMKDALRAPD